MNSCATNAFGTKSLQVLFDPISDIILDPDASTTPRGVPSILQVTTVRQTAKDHFPKAKLMFKATLRSNHNDLSEFESLAQHLAIARVPTLYTDYWQCDRKRGLHLNYTPNLRTLFEAARLPAIRIAESLSDWRYHCETYMHTGLLDGRQRTPIFSLQAVRFDLT